MLPIQTVTTAKEKLILAAILLLTSLASGCGNNEKAAYQLGAQAQQQLDQGNVIGARIAIDQALREKDDIVDLQLLKAKIEMAGKSPDAAYLAYYNAAALDPVNLEALQAIAMLGLQTGHTTDAELAAGKLITISPQNPTALLVRGLLAIERKRFSEALDAANRILANSVTDEGALVLKARALYLSGEVEQAKSVISKAENLSGASPGLSRISLEIGRAEGDPSVMLVAFQQLKSLGAFDPQLALDEANVRYKTNDRNGAAAVVKAALALPKASSDQLLMFKDLWQEYDRAAPYAGSLSAVSDGQARVGFARYLVQAGRFSEADRLLAGLNEKEVPGIRTRIMFGLGQTSQAQALAEQLVDDDPGQCDVRMTLATLAFKKRDLAAAVSNGQQAAAECPSLTGAWELTARAYIAGGQNEQAKRVFRDAIDRNPDHLGLHATFATWLMQSDKRAEAQSVVRHLLRYVPNRMSGWRLLASVCKDPSCQSDASIGLARARASFVIDRRPGEVKRRGLFAGLSGTGKE